MVNLTDQNKENDLSTKKSFIRTLTSAWMIPVSFIITLGAVWLIIYGIWRITVPQENKLLAVLILASAGILFAIGSLMFILTLTYKLLIDISNRSSNPVVIQPAKSGIIDADQLEKELKQIGLQIPQMIKLLSDINENILLDEQNKQKKFEFLVNQKIQSALAEVETLINKSEWAGARAILDTLIKKYPEKNELKEKLTRLEERRREAFNQELAKTRKLINDFIAISAWDKAVKQAEVLLEKHPDAQEAKELVAQIGQEREKFRTEQIKRMEADIQRSITRKRWNDALQIAQQLIDKYPDSPEAELLREKMETLRANAEIEKRQQLEEQIKDLIKRRNFIQALELAKYVIQEYPDSPQAQALREQMEKMEELASQQEKEINL